MLDFGPTGFSLFSIIMPLLMLAFYALVIYLILCVIRFMKEKTAHDRVRNEKLDELIKLLEERERQP